ncbi:MAG: hypothetical protein ACI4T6_03685 [Candidatus Flemingiibacterium sp.]
MGVYIAPEIKDRVAVGDDLYTITDSGGKKKLTPSPTEVSEPGTEINKALLQPMADALQEASADLVPYNDYWWRRRPTSGSYAETKQTAFGSSLGIASYYGSIITFFEHGEDEDFNRSVSFQTASKININQSTGAVSLVSPTSRTVKISDYSSTYDLRTALTDMCAGKYLKFTSNSAVLYVPSVSSVNQYNVASSVDAPIRSYIGYFSPDGDWGGWGSGTDVQLIGSVKKTATGAWEVISSTESDTYPESGTSGGYEYEYYGKIFTRALSTYVPKLKTVNVTSASYSSNSLSVEVPGSICFFWTDWTATRKIGYPFGLIVKDANTVLYIIQSYDINTNNNYMESHSSTTIEVYSNYNGGGTYTLGKYSNGELYFGTANGATSNYAFSLYLLPIVP